MSFPIIQRFEVEAYGCIANTSIALSRLHALIGPNDSGKSTILRALRTAAQFAAATFRQLRDQAWGPFDPMLDILHATSTFRLFTSDALAYQVRPVPDLTETLLVNGEELAKSPRPRGWNVPGILHGTVQTAGDQMEVVQAHLATLANAISKPTMIRFDPDFLRAPAPLIPESAGIALADDRGAGLASVFDAILNRDAEAFGRIQAQVRGLFPSVSKLGLINVSQSHKEMAITLTDGTRVGAKAMSEGLLYFLGFAALRHIDGSRLFLIEEPENGLHPSRIADVVRILREVAQTGQVVIATHSPLLVNELKGEEISVVTRAPKEGTQVTLLREVPGFEEASKVYLPGEFWVSYADGRTEEPLLTGKPRQ